jgi:Rod binding domain-containing protein
MSEYASAPVGQDSTAPVTGSNSGLASTDAQLKERQRSFEAALGRAGARAQPESPEQAARAAAEQLVTQCLILPLLRQLRATNQAAPPFAPSQAEKQFGALGDAQLAQRVTRASHFPLVDRLARDLLQRAGADASGRSAAEQLRTASAARAPTTARIPTFDRSSTQWQD